MKGLVALGKRYACFLERHWQMGRKAGAGRPGSGSYVP